MLAEDPTKKEITVRGLLFGFGRMGITHIALFNKYFSENIQWDVFEPSWKTRLMVRFLGSLANIKLVSDKQMSSRQYDLAIICSPPQFHQHNYDQIRTNSKKVFVEKPGFVDAQITSNIYVGYVLRHAPCVTYLKNKIENRKLTKVKIEIRANTVTEQGSGWRSSANGGGVVNEFGSHAINLAKYLVKSEYTVKQFETSRIVSANCPDVCDLSGVTESGVEVEIYLNWSDSTVRKPAYKISTILDDGTELGTDLFEVWEKHADHNEFEVTGVAHWNNNCHFYIRGLEFSEQARYFSEYDDFTQDFEDSIFTDKILKENS